MGGRCHTEQPHSSIGEQAIYNNVPSCVASEVFMCNFLAFPEFCTEMCFGENIHKKEIISMLVIKGYNVYRQQNHRYFESTSNQCKKSHVFLGIFIRNPNLYVYHIFSCARVPFLLICLVLECEVLLYIGVSLVRNSKYFEIPVYQYLPVIQYSFCAMHQLFLFFLFSVNISVMNKLIHYQNPFPKIFV